jgi:hypothetical protein
MAVVVERDVSASTAADELCESLDSAFPPPANSSNNAKTSSSPRRAIRMIDSSSSSVWLALWQAWVVVL